MSIDTPPTDDSDGWIPVDGVGEPVDEHRMTNLDLLPDITHPVRGRILRRAKQPRTVAELADAMQVPITRLYHHVNRLEELGLLRVVATRRVGAVTERRYQVAARSWKLAEEAFQTLEPSELSAAFGSLFDVAKLGLQREVESGLFADLDAAEDRFALSLGELRLRPETRRHLLDRLKELAEEFESDAEEDDPESELVTLFFAAFPEAPHEI
ncbi:MAG: helix-turn-helix domain-containing protein [Actinomycetota bacterium]